jgi:redox-regulated HSP33 family molecular chaperone
MISNKSIVIGHYWEKETFMGEFNNQLRRCQCTEERKEDVLMYMSGERLHAMYAFLRGIERL